MVVISATYMHKSLEILYYIYVCYILKDFNIDSIGLVSMSVPLYIAESVPAKIRGTLVVMNISFIAGGVLAAALVSGVFSNDSWPWGWR